MQKEIKCKKLNCVRILIETLIQTWYAIWVYACSNYDIFIRKCMSIESMANMKLLLAWN